MTLADRVIALYLTVQGHQDLGFLLGLKAERDGIECLVRQTDSLGIWVTVAGEDWLRVVVVPWRYVRAITFVIEGERPKEVKKTISVKPGPR